MVPLRRLTLAMISMSEKRNNIRSLLLPAIVAVTASCLKICAQTFTHRNNLETNHPAQKNNVRVGNLLDSRAMHVA
jgi:hypothetical protein